jgi:hypothetical protein
MVLIFSVVSCDSVGPSFSPDVDLAVHQAQWRQHGFRDYIFDYTISSVWVAPPPVRITVVADTVRSAIVIATGAAAPIAGLPTIDSLFATVGRSIQSEMGPPVIEYDSKLGYPRSIDTISSSPPDAGFTITVRSLVPVVLTQ